MTDLFTVAFGISLAAGLLTILIVVIVTHLSAEERPRERVYEAPPPAPHKLEPSPTLTPPSAPEQPTTTKEVKEKPPKPKKKPRKKGKMERYPDCFGTKYLYEKCKRDCGVVDECLKAIEILEPYS